jgi:hypothetical protein
LKSAPKTRPVRPGAGRTESAVMPLDESLRIMATMDAIRGQLGMKYPMEG